jgi:hypothetical protein
LCLQLSNLKHQTCVDHLTHLQQLLQLTPSQATKLVLRLPQLLMYAPAKLDRLFQGLAELVQGQDTAKKLVLQSPKVCGALSARLQYLDNLSGTRLTQGIFRSCHCSSCDPPTSYKPNRYPNIALPLVGFPHVDALSSNLRRALFPRGQLAHVVTVVCGRHVQCNDTSPDVQAQSGLSMTQWQAMSGACSHNNTLVPESHHTH